jgi:membrane associated rhomboid family serine protease
MGLHDRDYYREPPPSTGLGRMRLVSVTTWVVIINAAVFMADGLMQQRRVQQRIAQEPRLRDWAEEHGMPVRYWLTMQERAPLEQWGHFSVQKGIYQAQVWRLLTFQFLHADLWHLFANTLGLVLFGPIVEAHFGKSRYLAYYLLCGIAGVAMYLLLFAAGIMVYDAATPMVGASAGIFGVLVGAAFIAPDMEVPLFIGGSSVPVRVLAVAALLLAIFVVMRHGPNAGGQAAHVGGAVLGVLFMFNQHWLTPFAPARSGPTAARRRRRRFQKDWSRDMNR